MEAVPVFDAFTVSAYCGSRDLTVASSSLNLVKTACEYLLRRKGKEKSFVKSLSWDVHSRDT
jgi:hypothetical protein